MCDASPPLLFFLLVSCIFNQHINVNVTLSARNAESFGMNHCRLHGSPKNQATNTSASPLHHRLQPLDLMDDIPLTFCKETSTNSPILTTPIIEHNKIITPRRQVNHHQLHGLNDDLSSSIAAATAAAAAAPSTGATTNKHKSYGGGSMSHCGSTNGINIVSGSAYNCDASGSSAGHHHQKQSTSATAVASSSSHSHLHSHSKPTLHRSFSQQDQAPKLDDRCGLRHRWQACPELHKAMDGVNYIADHTRKEEESTKVIFSYALSEKQGTYTHKYTKKIFWLHSKWGAFFILFYLYYGWWTCEESQIFVTIYFILFYLSFFI